VENTIPLTTMNAELEERFSFMDGEAKCYCKKKRLVLYKNLTEEMVHMGRHSEALDNLIPE
jgi:hypothetical protein